MRGSPASPSSQPPAWAAHVDPLALERGSPLLQRLYRFLGAFSGGEEDPWLADQETGDVSLGFPVEVPQDCLHCGKTGAVPCEGCGCAAFCAPPMRWWRLREDARPSFRRLLAARGKV